jgi:hypothetical protein
MAQSSPPAKPHACHADEGVRKMARRALEKFTDALAATKAELVRLAEKAQSLLPDLSTGARPRSSAPPGAAAYS